jgi:hypothetical protein
MCSVGRLLQCSSGDSSRTLVRSAVSSCCCVGWLGPVPAELQPVTLAQPEDTRQSACSACRKEPLGVKVSA